MRLAIIAVLLLVGCAVGQDTTGNLVGGLAVCSHKHFGDKGLTDIDRCFYAKPGDCYRVKQDGTLEKVDACYNESELVTWWTNSGTVDVPAIIATVSITRSDWDLGGLDKYTSDDDLAASCKRSAGAWKDKACFLKKHTCADKSRILFTAEDGKHWCHKPQP